MMLICKSLCWNLLANKPGIPVSCGGIICPHTSRPLTHLKTVQTSLVVVHLVDIHSFCDVEAGPYVVLRGPKALNLIPPSSLTV